MVEFRIQVEFKKEVERQNLGRIWGEVQRLGLFKFSHCYIVCVEFEQSLLQDRETGLAEFEQKLSKVQAESEREVCQSLCKIWGQAEGETPVSLSRIWEELWQKIKDKLSRVWVVFGEILGHRLGQAKNFERVQAEAEFRVTETGVERGLFTFCQNLERS